MKIRICIPYRNREEHLSLFIPHICKYLSNKEFEILIIEQTQGKPFNRGKLANVGYLLSDNTSAFCVHDVDMLPQKVDYEVVADANHLAVNVSQFGYHLPFETYFGGVVLFAPFIMEKINGFNNDFWGWGIEDNDLFDRVIYRECTVFRPQQGFFSSLPHKKAFQKDIYEKNLIKLIKSQTNKSEYDINGLNSCDYKVIKAYSVEKNIKHFIVDI